jgi:hypothetical protein
VRKSIWYRYNQLNTEGSETIEPGGDTSKTIATDDASITVQWDDSQSKWVSDRAVSVDTISPNVSGSRADYLIIDDNGTLKAIDQSDGAVTDSGTDLGSVLNHAISNAARNTVQIAPMSANLSTSVATDGVDNITIIGAGQFMTEIVAQADVTMLDFANMSNLKLYGFRLNANNTATTALKTDSVVNLLLQDVWTRQANSTGVAS